MIGWAWFVGLSHKSKAGGYRGCKVIKENFYNAELPAGMNNSFKI